MSNRRMFSNDIVDTDYFLDMPISARALYFHLGIYTDDEGFVKNPRRLTLSVGCSNDDLRILADKGYIIPFPSGVVVITDFFTHNTIRKDRKKETLFKTERMCLQLNNGRYELVNTGKEIACQPSGNQIATILQPNDNQVETICQPNDRISKDNISKDNITKVKSNIYVANFECIWKIYPRKQDKALAYKAYNARLNDGYSEDELLTATKAYATECKKKDTPREYIKLAKTFFGPNTPFIDYLKAGEENAESNPDPEAERQRQIDEYNRRYGGV